MWYHKMCVWSRCIPTTNYVTSWKCWQIKVNLRLPLLSLLVSSLYCLSLWNSLFQLGCEPLHQVIEDNIITTVEGIRVFFIKYLVPIYNATTCTLLTVDYVITS